MKAVDVSAQTYPQNYFASPLTIPLSLAGNFGEIRHNHFHYGLDFRTNGKEGYPVIASADGYVSRVKVSGYGYGKVVYIDHPNGYTTVYGHLSKISGKLGEHIEKAQYAAMKFEYEYYPSPGEFKIKKGEVIGLSGNTGGSQGPHLHFEIRETKSEVPVNPLLFGFAVKDNVAPVVESVSVYSFSNLSSQHKRKDHSFIKGTRLLKDTLIIHGKGGIGFSGYDRETASGSKNGIYEMILLIDRDTVYHSRIDKFSFEESRFVNCHVDYRVRKKGGRTIEKTFIAPNNKAPIYLACKDRGILDLKDTIVHTAKLIAIDESNNRSEYSFRIRRSNNAIPPVVSAKGELFRYDKTNIYKKDDIQITLPSFVLYEDLDFVVKRSAPMKKMYSDVYSVSSDENPVQSAYILAIKPSACPNSLTDKLTIVSVGSKGPVSSLGGEWVNGMLSVDLKSFGRFAVYLDTIAPAIKPVNFKPGAKLTDTTFVKIRASDDLGDVVFFSATIDDEWKLFEFDAKSDTFTHTFRDKPDGKKHTVKITCADNRGNKSVKTLVFLR